MSIFKNFSPKSPVAEDRGMTGFEVTLERKNICLNAAENNYIGALTVFENQLQSSDMGTNRRNSTRQKRKLNCSGCTKKWCNHCCLASANKKLKEAGDLVEEIKLDIQQIKRRMGPQQHATPIPPCPEPPFMDSDDDEDSNIEEIQQENDIKQEADDSFVSIPFQFTIGIINTIKSEPMMEDYNESTDDSDESSDESLQEESQNTLQTENSYRDYPTTPERSDYTTDSEDSEDDADTEDEEPRPIRSILDLLNQ